jgi:flagellar hook-associated protein 2
VAAAINAAGAGVTAYVARTIDGARLVLKGQEGGANGFVLDAAETPGEEGLAALAWHPASGTAERLIAASGDASFKLDGLAMTSASNTVTDPAPGLTLTLRGTNAGAATQIVPASPVSAISSAMTDLTAALNEIATDLGAAADARTGDLSRDSGTRALRQMLTQLAGRIVMPAAPDSAPRTLADLGLATTREGGFRLDTARLTATLKANPTGAAAMFTSGLHGVFATIDSLARRATVAGNPGSLAGSIARYSAQQADVGEEQAKLAEAQERLRAQLSSRFAVADVRVGASRSTLSFLQNQIAAWNAKSQ